MVHSASLSTSNNAHRRVRDLGVVGGNTVGPNAPVAPAASAVTAADLQSLTQAIGPALKKNGIPLGRMTVTAGVPAGTVPAIADLDAFVKQAIETAGSRTLATNLRPWPSTLGKAQIPFQYIPDGCYARAQEMDLAFGQQSFNNMKIFAIGNLGASNSVFPNGVKWWYHVAPLVVVQNGANKELRVVDPAVDPNNPLMKPEDWIARIDTSKSSVNVEITDRGQYFPMNGAPPSNDAFQANLGAAHDTCVSYEKALLQIIGSGPGAVPHAHTAVPASVNPATGRVTFMSSPRVFTAANDAHLASLVDAAKKRKRVSITAEHDTGVITSVRPAP